MAGMLPCSNEDGNAATFMISNLAGDQQQWVCGYCLGMLGLATLVEVGAFTQEQVKALMDAGEPVDQADAGATPDKPKRARKRAAAGKVTGEAGETTPIEPQHPCMIRGEGCTGVGTVSAPDVETPGDNDWACEVCIARFAGTTAEV